MRVGGLPGFPSTPARRPARRRPPTSSDEPLESHFCDWPDAETRVLRRGEDFDVVVFAIPVGMAPIVCRELIDDRREWRAMVEHVTTTATQAVQLWLREDEPSLGWREPGATVSAYEHAASTPGRRCPSSSTSSAGRPPTGRARSPTSAARCRRPGRPTRPAAAYVAEHRAHVRANAVDLVERQARAPAARARRHDGSFRWELLCGRERAQRAQRDRHPALPRQRRPVRPLRAVRTGKRRATGCAPTRAATTTSSSPATGPTTASTRAASRRPRCPACRPPTPCSADRASYRIAGTWLS